MATTSSLSSIGMDAQTLNATRPTKSFNLNNPKDMAQLKKVGQDFEDRKSTRLNSSHT